MKRALWALLVAVPLVAVLAYGFGRDPNVIASPLINKPAPPFSLRTLGNRTLSLRSLRGRAVVLNFSASWCLACKQEQQDLVDAWLSYAPKGVVFVSVAFKDSPGAERAFMRQYGAAWPVLEDPNLQTALDFGVSGVPETFFIDRSGVVRFKSTGPVTADVLQRDISRISRRAA